MAEAHYMAITVNGSAFFFLFADTGQWTHSPGKCAIPFRKKKKSHRKAVTAMISICSTPNRICHKLDGSVQCVHIAAVFWGQ